jgi:hypothetical protein
MRKAVLIFFGVIAFFAFFGGMMETPKTPKTPEQIAAEEKANREFQRAASLVRALKNSMHNPASFQLVDAILMPDNSLCVEYRGTNAFGGVVTNRHVFTNQSSSNTAQTWNKYCAGKTGRDMRHIRAVI